MSLDDVVVRTRMSIGQDIAAEVWSRFDLGQDFVMWQCLIIQFTINSCQKLLAMRFAQVECEDKKNPKLQLQY